MLEIKLPRTFDLDAVKKFCIKQFLPIGFLVAVVWGLAWPDPGSALYHWSSDGWKIMVTINMCIIFFIFGITLETSELKTAFKAWKALLFGLISELFITAITGYIPPRMGFQPEEFGIGLAVMACVPTSLSSGVTLVFQAYGNSALALMMTVCGNLLGIFTAPIMVKLVLDGLDASIDTVSLLVKLLVSIFVPLLTGKVLREMYKPTAKFAKKHKIPLYMFNNLQIVIIVWQTLSHSRNVLIQQKFVHVVLAIFAAIVQHFFFLVLNTTLSWIIRIPSPERKACIIMPSQKALPVAAVIINYLGSEIGDLGLISIPCIVFYVMQLFIDAFITSGWASKYEKQHVLVIKYAALLEELNCMSDAEISAQLCLNVTMHERSAFMETRVEVNPYGGSAKGVGFGNALDGESTSEQSTLLSNAAPSA